MVNFLSKYIAVFLTGFTVSYFLTPVVRWVAVRFGIVDLPNERRPHKQPTARGGGLAVFLGFHAACLVAVLVPWPTVAGTLDFAWWQRFVLPSVVLLFVGLIDDIRGMRPLVKLGGQALAASLIFLGGARFGIVIGHQLPLWLDFLMVNFWILAVINAFNLVDGLDGLAPGGRHFGARFVRSRSLEPLAGQCAGLAGFYPEPAWPFCAIISVRPAFFGRTLEACLSGSLLGSFPFRPSTRARSYCR